MSKVSSAGLNMFSQVGAVEKVWFFQEGKQSCCPGESWQMIISRGCWWKAENKLPFFSFIMQQVRLFPPDEHSQGHLLLSSCTDQEQKHSSLSKHDLPWVYSVQVWAQEPRVEQSSLELILIPRHADHLALIKLSSGTWHVGLFLSHCGVFTPWVTTDLQGSLET